MEYHLGLILINRVNDFRVVGPEALKPKRKGRRSIVSKPEEIFDKLSVIHATPPFYLSYQLDPNDRCPSESLY